MSTQQQIKARIRTATNIQHIAEAMEIVSGVQFRKVMHKKEDFNRYAQKLNELTQRLQSNATSIQHPLFDKNSSSRIGIIIVTGDKGLCGSYNENALKNAENFLKQFDPNEIELFLLGKKAVDHFKNKKWTIKQKIIDLHSSIKEETIHEWASHYIADFHAQSFGELWIVFTHFINILTRTVQVEKILPLQIAEINTAASSTVDFLFEPNPKEIYETIIPYSFYIQLQAYLLDSQAAELSSRMIAMKSAAKNADEMIENLTLIKNKNRQLMITNEILEITAGVESLK